MNLKCRVCGKELPEFDQRGFRNAGFTAHQNRCIERERERREGITRRPQRAHTTHGHRRLLPASSSLSPPPFINYYRRNSSQRRRRHSLISDAISLEQSSAPASFSSSPPSFSSQQLGPSTFLNFNTVSSGQQQPTLQSQPPPPPLFSSFPVTHHHPNYYVSHAYCSQNLPSSSITVSSSTAEGVATGSTYPSEHITGSFFFNQMDHDPIIQQHQSPLSSSPITTLSPSQQQQQQQQIQSNNNTIINYMEGILPQEEEEEEEAKPSNCSSLSAPPDLQFHGIEASSITRSHIDFFPVQHCDYCIPNSGLHDPNCYLLLQFVTGATTTTTTTTSTSNRAPQGPSSSTY
ncbi:hypothetical protein INT45_008501 [Circinella minor]|uniref:Uncharacterized protein n=1 Tax=Circinella minor TaxID=1195481 RepID=A0A8H7VQ55_9FUNG|nr:hypothetical protein INT45_008501 [Circinella minor]